MANNFIYTISTGRCGTTYLKELLQENIQDIKAYHERAFGLNFGVHSPDASDFTYFNHLGNVPKVQQFWQRKLKLDKEVPEQTYAEMSHVLVKAGLIENLSVLSDDPNNKIHLIILKRDIKQIAWSFYNRFDFANTGFTTLWYLDYRYPNSIISFKQFKQFGMVGYILWYIHEMYTRAEYYKLLLKDTANIIFHEKDLSQLINQAGAKTFFNELELPIKTPDIIIPPKKNATKAYFFPDSDKEKINKICDTLMVDHAGLAKEFFDAGRRLASPKYVKNV